MRGFPAKAALRGGFSVILRAMRLDWGERRRYAIVGGAALLGLLALGGVAFAFLYEPPTCTDGRANGAETGTDCGGVCERICSVDAIAARAVFARALVNTSGRIDAVAYVENRNPDAEAKNVPFTVELFAEDGESMGSYQGMVDLPAKSVVPVFVPGVARGYGSPRAFLTVGDTYWRAASDPVPAPQVVRADLLDGTAPRVVAELANESAVPLVERTLVATVFDAEGVAIAASSAVVREIPARGAGTAVFTWNDPFPAAAARVEVRPVPTLLGGTQAP